MPNAVGLDSFLPFSATQHPPLRTSPVTLLTALCGHWPLDRHAAVRPVEGDIRCNRESAALWFLLYSSLMAIDKVGL